jgi:hypothetical protein
MLGFILRETSLNRTACRSAAFVRCATSATDPGQSAAQQHGLLRRRFAPAAADVIFAS